MGKHRQNLNRMINTGAQWSFNDMCRAAQFFGVSIDTLMRPDLTQSELKGNGGLPVVNVETSAYVAGRGRPRLWFWPPDRAARDHNPEVQGSNPCPATNVVIWPLISVPKSAAFPFTVAIWMKGDQAATVPREVGDHKRLVIFIADLQLSNPREATGVKFLNEAEAGHKSYVTIDFVPSSRSSAQKRSVVHHPATSSASCRSGSTYRPAHRPVLNRS